jgi:TonB-linked SusC/RagA family outer membrane protein
MIKLMSNVKPIGNLVLFGGLFTYFMFGSSLTAVQAQNNPSNSPGIPNKLYYSALHNAKIVSGKMTLPKRHTSKLQRLTLQQKITGTVTDASTNKPLAGVNILVVGTPSGAATDANGHYNLTAPDSADSLRFSFIGYKTQTVDINGRSEINIALKPQVQVGQQVVVTALGIKQQKRELGYSVETVQTKELTTANNANIVSDLQGKVAGVQVNNVAGGSPGGSSRIIIRGMSSLGVGANNQPLFVVDGIPIDNSTITAGDHPRKLGNRAIDLNADDIKSLTVLKGPAASALYGLRAANGAIIITTKRGQAGKVKVNFKNSVGFERVNKYPEFQKVYGQGFDGQASLDSFWPTWGGKYSAVGDTLPGYRYHDIWRDAMNTGFKYNDNISVSGGNDVERYYGSVSHLSHNGVIPYGNWKRTSVRFNNDFNISRDLKISSDLNYIHSGGNHVSGDRFMEELQYYAPTHDVRDYEFTKGPLKGTMKGYYGDGHAGGNPIYFAKVSQYEDNVNRLIGDIKIDYNFTNWLSASYRLGLDRYHTQRTNTLPGPTGIANENVLSSTGYINLYSLNNRDLNSTLIVTLKYDFSDKFKVNLKLGQNVYDHNYHQIIGSGSNFVVPGFLNLSNVRNQSSSQYKLQRRVIGVYGDLTAGYDDYLFLNITGRNDWSSTLPVANRSFFYPSYNLGFVFSSAFNMPDYLSYGKIRLSYATVGKDAPAYSTGITFSSPSIYPLNGQVGYTRNNTVGSSDLKPEKTTSIETGINLKFLNNRVGIDFTWYRADSKDQIFTVPISNTTGATRLVTNAGEILNRGVEIQLNVTPIQTKNINWNLRFNYSRNRNTVVSLSKGLESILLGSSFGYAGGGANITLKPGEPFGNIYGSSYARYQPKKSDYLDRSAPIIIGDDGFPEVNRDNLVLGNAFPNWIGGIYNQFTYKNISLSFLIDAQIGIDVYSQYDNFFTAFGATKITLNRNDSKIFKGITEDGQPNTKKVWLGQGVGPDGNDYGAGFYRNVYRGVAENFVKNASFVKLRNIKFSYSLPNKVLDNVPLTKVTAAVAVTNLILYTPFKGFDPESRTGPASSNATGFTGLTYPAVAGLNFSLNFSF